jgi:hypothetical protein
MAMPGTSVMLGGGTVSRTPIAVRPGSGGYYTAYAVGYPSPTSIRLWRVGAGSTLAISKASGSPQVAVAADANGRLWVAWSDGVFGSKRVRAVRSNRNATRWGAIVDAGAVKGGNSVYSLDADATTGALDALALFGVGTNNENATYVTRILPGLTLKASRRSLGDKPRRVTFTVTDAGDAVKGATVKVSGRSATTGKSGKVTFTLSDKATARASASGYTGASVRLR